MRVTLCTSKPPATPSFKNMGPLCPRACFSPAMPSPEKLASAQLTMRLSICTCANLRFTLSADPFRLSMGTRAPCAACLANVSPCPCRHLKIRPWAALGELFAPASRGGVDITSHAYGRGSGFFDQKIRLCQPKSGLNGSSGGCRGRAQEPAAGRRQGRGRRRRRAVHRRPAT